LSTNLSCQLDGLLYQVQAQGQGLALRGADVTIVSRPDSPSELFWEGRLLPHTLSTKPVKQRQAVDSKGVDSKVDLAVKRRTPSQPIGPPLETPNGSAAWQQACKGRIRPHQSPSCHSSRLIYVSRGHFYLALTVV